jgi:hypothetical protein
MKAEMREYPGHRKGTGGVGSGPERPVAGRMVALIALAPLLLPVALHSARLAAFPPASSDISPAAAESLASKIALLSSASAAPANSLAPIPISEGEANSYLKFRGHGFLPSAVQNPEIHITPQHISGTAEVDFDKLGETGAQTDDWGARIVAVIFKGKQRVLATGILETLDGKGKLSIESLTVGTTSIPAGFVNFLVQSYMERKYGIDLSKPFDLPLQVSYIEMGSGRAVFHRAAARKSKAPAGR